ncbi:hypothetical protein SCHPADRAFT_889692 [Schizopora paradoxa]|uniref:Uncharacterized protein n=1 Tax=Schizopora paradoxa TaxID=27342 RepID=A0A0H2RWX3_9AGAM|nr:hypothetical protein SCHPADRAFT_889692 [Schizopora paradoxa]
MQARFLSLFALAAASISFAIASPVVMQRRGGVLSDITNQKFSTAVPRGVLDDITNQKIEENKRAIEAREDGEGFAAPQQLFYTLKISQMDFCDDLLYTSLHSTPALSHQITDY